MKYQFQLPLFFVSKNSSQQVAHIYRTGDTWSRAALSESLFTYPEKEARSGYTVNPRRCPQ